MAITLDHRKYKPWEHKTINKINVWETEGKSTMGNPEKLAILATKDTRRRQTKQNTKHNMS